MIVSSSFEEIVMKNLNKRAEQNTAFIENVETEDLQLHISQMQEEKSGISQVSNQDFSIHL